MDEQEREYFRINTRISRESNEWLDERSKAMGIPKSALVNLAIENYIEQKMVIRRMSDMGEIASKLDELINAVEQAERNDPK